MDNPLPFTFRENYPTEPHPDGLQERPRVDQERNGLDSKLDLPHGDH